MAIIAVKDFKIKESYAKLIEKAFWSYLWEGIYKPMFEIINLKPPKAKNEYNPIIEGLKNGTVFYADGGFKAKIKFTNVQSLQLKKWGAVYDKWTKTWRLPQSMLPQAVWDTLQEIQTENQMRINALDTFLKEVQNNMPYIVESMVFNNEVVTILDDAGNEIKKNVKRLNVITPELSVKQKKEIAEIYTNNIQQYAIKDFGEERIPEMRKKVQEAALNGYRMDTVQEMLEKEYGIGSRKAKFLARNETTIMLAEYKKVTYQEMGSDGFIWNTIMDGKERDLHKELNGTTWTWDDLPVIDERTGQKGLPGEMYNCRCSMLPFFKDSPFKMATQKFGITESEKRINKYIASNAYEDVEWITVKGNHIPIKKGQTKEQAVKEFIAKKEKGTPSVEGGVETLAKEIYKIWKEANCESTEPAEMFPKTIAGVKRGKPMTFEQADGGRVNPHFNRTNPAYYRNCQSCVVAFEARLRGYNLQAAPKNRNGKTQELSQHSSWAYIDPKTGKKCEYTKINVSNVKEHYAYLNKNIKPNERYQMTYTWKERGTNKLHGHVLTIARDKNGKLMMYDPQTNQFYLNKNIEKHFSRPEIIYSVKPKILRVDDKKFNLYFINDVTKGY